MHPNGRSLFLPPFSFSPTPTWTVCQSHKPISSFLLVRGRVWESPKLLILTHFGQPACRMGVSQRRGRVWRNQPDHKNSNTRLRGKILRKKQIYLFRASFCAGIRACVVACALLHFGDKGAKKEEWNENRRSRRQTKVNSGLPYQAHMYKHTMGHQLNSTEIVCANMFFLKISFFG